MEAAGGQRVSGAKRWPFRLDMADLQVNKQRGCSGGGADDDMIRDRSHFKSFVFLCSMCGRTTDPTKAYVSRLFEYSCVNSVRETDKEVTYTDGYDA